ncbi:MAG: ATP-binding cassette domain-containing protein [Gammaproteobacteria bacterium]|nr:ATP-binding cassette domain-containing protein [Gammaproteobacteria bacterium]
MADLLEIEDLCLEVGKDNRWHRIIVPSLKVQSGQVVVILGSSGVGKSVLMRTLAGLQLPERMAGHMHYYAHSGKRISLPWPDTEPVSPCFQDLFYLFQEPLEVLDRFRTIRDYAVLLAERLKQCREQRNIRADFEAALQETGLDKEMDTRVATLSGGESQQLMLAIMRVLRPRLILADEPLSSQDHDSHDKLRGNILSFVEKAQPGVLLVTHETRDMRDFGMVPGTVFHIFEKEASRENSWSLSAPIPAEKMLAAIACAQAGDKVSETLPPALREMIKAAHELGHLALKKDSSPARSGRLQKKSGKDGRNELVLEVSEISHQWQNRDGHRFQVLDRVSLQHRRGENTGLTGPSGSGKSTLLEAMLRFFEPDAGKVIWKMIPVPEHEFRKQVQYVFQDCARAMAWESGSLREVLAAPFGGHKRRKTGQHIEKIAEILGLSPVLDREIVWLSGGEKHRAFLARAWLMLQHQPRQPAVLVLDEFTVGLDLVSQLHLLKRLVKATSGENHIFDLIVVSHDPYVIDYLCDQVVRMEKSGQGGRIV